MTYHDTNKKNCINVYTEFHLECLSHRNFESEIKVYQPIHTDKFIKMIIKIYLTISSPILKKQLI